MIREILIKNKSAVLEKWIKSITDTYPAETSNFLRLQKNRFSNPVGFAVSAGAEKILNEILNEGSLERIKDALTDIIKIRAVQDFTPSQAAGIMLSLKKIIIDELDNKIKDWKSFEEFIKIESGIDNVILYAFDLYTEAREKVHQIRINEIKARMLYDGPHE